MAFPPRTFFIPYKLSSERCTPGPSMIAPASPSPTDEMDVESDSDVASSGGSNEDAAPPRARRSSWPTLTREPDVEAPPTVLITLQSVPGAPQLVTLPPHTSFKNRTASPPLEKREKCFICFKKFTSPARKKTHMRGHTGEQPYSCSACDQRFSRRDSCVRHIEAALEARWRKAIRAEQHVGATVLKVAV